MAEKTGRPIPEELQTENRPELLPGLFLYYQAFHDLGSCRPVGFGVGAIPYTAIVMWMDENGANGAQRERGFVILKAMDGAFLEYLEKKRKAEEAKGAKHG